MLFKNKVLHSFLILLLFLSLFNPIFAIAETRASIGDISQGDDNIRAMKEIVNQHQNLIQQDPYLHPSLQKLEGEEEISVIVQLSEAPVALEEGKKKLPGKGNGNGKGRGKGKGLSAVEKANVLNKVRSQQAAFVRELSNKKVSFSEYHTYQYALNGMSMIVKGKDIEKLLELDGVVSIEPDEQVYALEDTFQSGAESQRMDESNDFLEITKLWEMGYKGEGVKVAVLDTGIDYDHPDFKDVYKGGFNFVPHDDRIYSRSRADNDPYETSPLDLAVGAPDTNGGSTFHTTHGTHVAGIIAGNGDNEYGIAGIAPEVELYAYRVMGAYGSGNLSWIIAGIDKAVEEGMDIINLSLSGGSNSSITADAVAINNAVLAGVTAILATGNAGPSRASIGNPGSAALGISVGNTTLPKTTLRATLTVSANDFEATYGARMMAWDFATNPEVALNGTFDLVAVPNFGVSADYNNIDVKNRVVLVSRGGQVALEEKIAAAKQAGAAGILLHNNVEGQGPIGASLGDSFDFLPTFDLSTAEGTALRAAIESENAGNVTITSYERSLVEGDDVNSSSSRGPSTPFFDIKPDVVAPGTNIMAAVPAFAKDFAGADYSKSYARKTGTSMAAPQVAGVAALLLSANPDWTPFDLKVAISNTAKLLDTNKYDVFTQGPGRIQPYEAVTAKALAYSLDSIEHEGEQKQYEKGTVTFGRVIPNPEQEIVITRQIELRSLVDFNREFTVSVQTTKAATGDLAGASVTVDKDSFDLHGSETLTVTLTVPSGEEDPGNEMLGYIQLSNGNTDLVLPFAAEFSTYIPKGLEYFELESSIISPNGNGKYEYTYLDFGLLHDDDLMSIEFWDAGNPNAGFYGDGYIGYLAFQPLPSGYYDVQIGSGYYDWADDVFKEIPEGVYTVNYHSWNPDTFAFAQLGWDGPLYVKTSDPKLRVDKIDSKINTSHYEVTGTVDDKFIEYKSTVETVFGEGYDVNDKLHLGYALLSNNGKKELATGNVLLEQDGSFAFDLSDLSPGKYTLKLSVEDIVELSTYQELQLHVVGNSQGNGKGNGNGKPGRQR
ncbi:S8 family serine peptidase [Evansella sp. AB-rgal1]|uniref:S8 family serine peptidase n=1 Tax=Evansella sp. AB-rgal1 TaxID=3242696 RepID=UPI00359DB412